MRFSEAITKIPAPALWLGVAGLLPFWLPFLLLGSETEQGATSRALLIQMGYGAVILSFLGGIRWGAALKLPPGPLQATLFVLSVMPSLAGFVALLLPATVGLILLIGGFLLQGVWDVQSSQRGELPPWYATLRAMLTTGAVLALIAAVMVRAVAVA